MYPILTKIGVALNKKATASEISAAPLSSSPLHIIICSNFNYLYIKKAAASPQG